MYEEDDDRVIFVSSEGILQSGKLETGAAMLVSTSSLQEASLKEWFEDQVAEFDFESGGPAMEITPRTVRGRRVLIFALEAIPTHSETLVRGFMAATDLRDCGYFFISARVADEWPEYGPALEEMLGSIQFVK